MGLNTLFTNFTKTLNQYRRMSVGSKYDEMIDFHILLNAFITHEATTDKTKDHKNRTIKYVKPICYEYFNAYKKSYDSKVKDE